MLLSELTAAWKDAEQPPLTILWLAGSTWYPPDGKPEPRKLVDELKCRLELGDWRAAADIAERLDPLIPAKRPDYEKELPWEWRAAIAELYLFAGELSMATERLHRILEAIPAPAEGELGRSSARMEAAHTAARIAAERGDFAEALDWLERAPRESWTGCGNCKAGRKARAHPVSVVWKCALLPYEQASVKLEAVRAGEFVPLESEILDPENQIVQARHAADEAALILGELHLRNGHPRAAWAPLEAASFSPHELAYLARTHLLQL